MSDLHMDDEDAGEEIAPLPPTNPRRQRQQLRFAAEEDEEEVKEDKQQKAPSTFQPPGRASRFLSICAPSLQLPGASLLRLQQLHNAAANNQDSLFSGEISDELLAKIPFKIEIIPDRRDDFDLPESALTKNRHKNKETLEIPTVLASGLSDERRLEIIEQIFKDLSQTNVLDDVRRSNSIPFHLPKETQMQKNIANRIEDLTGSDVIMLNDQLYMKNLCQRLQEKHQKELEIHFQRLASNGKHQQRKYHS